MQCVQVYLALQKVFCVVCEYSTIALECLRKALFRLARVVGAFLFACSFTRFLRFYNSRLLFADGKTGPEFGGYDGQSIKHDKGKRLFKVSSR